MMVATWVVLLPALLVLVSLIFFAISKGGRAGKVVLGVFLVLLGFVFVGLISFRAVSVPRPITEVVQSYPVDAAAAYTGGGTAWRDGVEDEMKADVYSSKAAAVRGLARELEIIISAKTEEETEPALVRIVEGEVEIYLLGELRESLDERLEADVVIGGEGEGVKVLLGYAETQEHSIWKNQIQHGTVTQMRQVVGGPMESGLITATVETGAGKEVESAKFFEKDWLTDIQEFSQSAGSHWVVARSNDACMSEEQAMIEAMANVRNIIMPIEQRGRRFLSDQEIINLGFVSDKFVQSFYGSAGRIWRAAVLVDVSPERMRLLSMNVQRVQRRQRSNMLEQVMLLGGVILLICVIYWFLNAATKGYYSWRLRLLAILLVAGGILLVLVMS